VIELKLLYCVRENNTTEWYMRDMKPAQL